VAHLGTVRKQIVDSVSAVQPDEEAANDQFEQYLHASAQVIQIARSRRSNYSHQQYSLTGRRHAYPDDSAFNIGVAKGMQG